ncbi:MAG TPA: hypothetical protein VGN57_23100 [Pirellulaceae bacterium]|nr:hypothetical protein [Pirellulaceae bacterium]
MAKSDEFDPYYVWLGIPPGERPPTHYRLLDIPVFESDPNVIDIGFNRRMAYLQSIKDGARLEAAERLKNELSEARRCLLIDDRRSRYETDLRKRIDEQDRLNREIQQTQAAAFRREVERAFADGIVDERERQALQSLARQLGLPSDLAARLYQETEGDVAERRQAAEEAARHREAFRLAREREERERSLREAAEADARWEAEAQRQAAEEARRNRAAYRRAKEEGLRNQAEEEAPRRTTPLRQEVAPSPVSLDLQDDLIVIDLESAASRGAPPPMPLRIDLPPRPSAAPNRPPAAPVQRAPSHADRGAADRAETQLASARSTVQTCMLLSGVLNLVVGGLWSLIGLASTGVGVVLGVPLIVLGLVELGAQASRASHREFATNASTIGILECVAGLCNPLSAILGIIVLVRASSITALIRRYRAET